MRFLGNRPIDSPFPLHQSFSVLVGTDTAMPNEPKTDAALLERLQEAAKYVMTAEEIRRQRVSFVYGNMSQDAHMTRHQVQEVLARLEGEAA